MYIVWLPPLYIKEEGSGDISRVMLCSVYSNIPATLIFCNYVGAISIPTQKDGEIHSRQMLPFYTSIVYVCHQTLPPLCEVWVPN